MDKETRKGQTFPYIMTGTCPSSLIHNPHTLIFHSDPWRRSFLTWDFFVSDSVTPIQVQQDDGYHHPPYQYQLNPPESIDLKLANNMSLRTAQDDSPSEIADIDWHMLDKSKFFFFGAASFSGVSAILYPVVVLKTRQQVSPTPISSLKLSYSIMRHEGIRGFYRGFGTSLMGTIPARALYMGALEVTKSGVGSTTVKLGFSDTTAVAIANAAAGLSSAMAAQFVWTPVDVVSQRLMVQGCNKQGNCRYSNGIDAFRKIMHTDGPRGLYRGFGISIVTYAPSNAVWWTSYSVANRFITDGIGSYYTKKKDENNSSSILPCCGNRPISMSMLVVQGVSAALASGVSALVTMPLDTIKTRVQVLDREENGRRSPLTIMQTVKNLVKEGGLGACYRGLGPRWASMSLSATIMVTTYEFLKRLSATN